MKKGFEKYENIAKVRYKEQWLKKMPLIQE